MHRLGTWTLAVLSVSALGLAGCSSSSSTPSTTTPAPIATVPTADRSPVGTAGTAPTITVPTGAPPTTLESSDLIVGAGPEAKAGDTVTVQYVLATYSSGKVVQSSWTHAPFTFPLGEGDVIPGWDKGVVGMKVGGRRELIIPPDLGYGAQSPGPGISANDTLVFIVDMLKIK
jgi:peptidylprolyl isomerase